MNLINATKMQAGYTMGLDKDARESLVVVVKGTFRIPRHEVDEPRLTTEQVPLVTADVFTGEPGLSAMLYETDYAPVKRRCDVLLNGSAYAPGGRPTERVTVTLRVGSLVKSFDVVGHRTWRANLLTTTPGRPEPFTQMPIGYDNAFGGVDRTDEDPTRHRWYVPNPAGKGYFAASDPRLVDGQPCPNTEETGRPVAGPKGNYRPMAFGPLGRAWPDRVKYAGTYDQKWLDDVMPFLPKDFDERYFQAAPEDQQTDYLRGGEEVELTNLTPKGRTVFRIPTLAMPVVFFPRRGKKEETTAVIDTLLIEPDKAHFLLTWRASRPIRRNLFEVTRIVTGVMPAGWYRADARGKTYYRSLRELTVARRTPAEDQP